MRTVSTAAHGLGDYVRHHPEDTLLYEIVRDHLEPFLTHVREQSGRSLPRYVEQEFRKYLRCGILAHGFLRLYCDRCGKDLLVAFSCKGRGLCPSCGARRMCGSAAQLVDRVLPDVPLRQWVLSVPFELRLLLASKAEVLSAVIRIFMEEVFRWYTEQAQTSRITDPKCGAVTFTQRFGGSLNLNVHLHVIVLDGVYSRDYSEGTLYFYPVLPPTREDLTLVVGKVARRVFCLLHRKNLIDTTPFKERSNGSPDPDVLQACFQAGVQRGLFATLNEKGQLHPPDDSDNGGWGHRSSSRWTADVDRFNVHAGVTVAKGDRGGREHLCRYVLRPSLSLQRLSRLPDGSTERIEKASRLVYGTMEGSAQTAPPGARIAAACDGETRIDWASLLKRVYPRRSSRPGLHRDDR